MLGTRVGQNRPVGGNFQDGAVEASDETTKLAELKKRIQQFIDERGWGRYHNPKDVAVSVSIEAADAPDSVDTRPRKL